MDQMLHVSSNPHVRDKMTTSKIMQLVALALLEFIILAFVPYW